MPHALAEIYLHVVFSTKDRVPFLGDPVLRSEMHSYLAGACRNLKCPALIVGGVEDHVHILCRYGRTITIANLLKGLKQESSKWIKKRGQSLGDFYWQEGYGVFSTIPDRLAALRRYIERQEEHHKKESIVAGPRPRTALRLSWASKSNPVGIPEDSTQDSASTTDFPSLSCNVQIPINLDVSGLRR